MLKADGDEEADKGHASSAPVNAKSGSAEEWLRRLYCTPVLVIALLAGVAVSLRMQALGSYLHAAGSLQSDTQVTCSAHDVAQPQFFRLQHLSYNNSLLRDVPVIQLGNTRYARLSDTVVLSAHADDSDEWTTSSSVTVAQFTACVQARYRSAELMPEALETSAGYFKDFTLTGQHRRVALIKTHKTGSTTLRGVLYRMVHRYKLRLLRQPSDRIISVYEVPKEEKGTYDAVLDHHTPEGNWQSGSFSELTTWYNDLVKHPHIVTIVRDPLSLLLSRFYFFTEPTRRDEEHPERHLELLRQFLGERESLNPLAAEFGLCSVEEIEQFVRDDMRALELVAVLERFEESLVALRHVLNLDMRELVHMVSLDRSKGDLVRWDGKALMKNPDPLELGEELMTLIRERISGDELLVDTAHKLLDEKLEGLKGAGVDVDGEVAALKELNELFSAACASWSEEYHSTCDSNTLQFVK